MSSDREALLEKRAKFNDGFYRITMATTQKVFEWLRWAATLAAVQYVAERTDSPALKALVIICTVLLAAFYGAFFLSALHQPVQKSSRTGWLPLLAYLAACALAVGTGFAVIATASELAKQSKVEHSGAC